MIGSRLSGKTTGFNHLQILYGNGITDLERLVAFEIFVRNLVHTILEAVHIMLEACSVCTDPFGQDDQDRQKADWKVRNTINCHVLCYAVVNGANLPSICKHWSVPQLILIALRMKSSMGAASGCCYIFGTVKKCETRS